MKNNKTTHWLLPSLLFVGLAALLTLANDLVAQMTNVATNSLPEFDPATAPLPTSVRDYWQFSISLITPAIIWVVYKFIPKIPKPLLLSLVPVTGIVVGFIHNSISAQNWPWVDNALLGGFGTFVRELINKGVTEQVTPVEEKIAKKQSELAVLKESERKSR